MRIRTRRSGASTPATRAIAELIGRLPVIGAVSNLDREALIRILTEPKNALIKQYRKFFEFEDVDLEFTDDALDAIADQALLRGTGARGLRADRKSTRLNSSHMSISYAVFC